MAIRSDVDGRKGFRECLRIPRLRFQGGSLPLLARPVGDRHHVARRPNVVSWLKMPGRASPGSNGATLTAPLAAVSSIFAVVILATRSWNLSGGRTSAPGSVISQLIACSDHRR